MTDQPNDALKALAEAAFDLPVAEETSPPIGADEYRAKQAAERAKMARLRAARLAEEAGCEGQAKEVNLIWTVCRYWLRNAVRK